MQMYDIITTVLLNIKSFSNRNTYIMLDIEYHAMRNMGTGVPVAWVLFSGYTIHDCIEKREVPELYYPLATVQYVYIHFKHICHLAQVIYLRVGL